MRFDDRLQTVLSQPADDRHDAAVRWRQLVDLVARAGPGEASDTLKQAIQVIRDEAPDVDEPVRAAASRAVAGLSLPLRLLEYFASEQLAIAAPVLTAVRFDPDQWQAVRDAANQETLALIASLQPAPEIEAERAVERRAEPAPEIAMPIERRRREPRPPATVSASPPPPPPVEPQPWQSAPAPAAPPAYTPPSLHEVVERIERRRQARDVAAAPATPDPAPSEPPALFRWECDAGGEIAWVEGAPRGPLIGRSIARVSEREGDRIDRDLVRAFGLRAPFRDAELVVAGGGAVTGSWRFSGVPAFDPLDGRFAGYRGVALRDVPAEPRASPEPIPEALADPASLRELVHEIKTPLNAILGFAEIIEGQYFGPADRGYRDRAAEIMRQARLLLTAIEDLDFAARVHSVAGAARDRVDLGQLAERELAELRRLAAPRPVDVSLVRPRRPAVAAVQPELAERLLHRLAGTLLEHAGDAERLQLIVEPITNGARLSMSRPQALRGIADAELFNADHGAGIEGGFALRLVRGLARIAGGELIAARDVFSLVFPPS